MFPPAKPVTPDEHQRMFVWLLMAVHDIDEAGFKALLNSMPQPAAAYWRTNSRSGIW